MLCLERFRHKMKAWVSKFVHIISCIVVHHKDLEGDNSDLLRSYGAHLNDIGLDIFNLGIIGAVEKALTAVGCLLVYY